MYRNLQDSDKDIYKRGVLCSKHTGDKRLLKVMGQLSSASQLCSDWLFPRLFCTIDMKRFLICLLSSLWNQEILGQETKAKPPCPPTDSNVSGNKIRSNAGRRRRRTKLALYGFPRRRAEALCGTVVIYPTWWSQRFPTFAVWLKVKLGVCFSPSCFTWANWFVRW